MDFLAVAKDEMRYRNESLSDLVLKNDLSLE